MFLETIRTMIREHPLRSFLSIFALLAGSFLLGSAWGIADSLSRLLDAARGSQGLILTIANGVIAEDGSWSRTMPPQFPAGIDQVLATAMDGTVPPSPVVNTPFGRIMVGERQIQIRQVLGVGPTYLEVTGFPLLAGAMFSQADVDGRQPRAVISSEIASTLFDSPEAAIGQTFDSVMPGRPGQEQGAPQESRRQRFTIAGVFQAPSAAWRMRHGNVDMLLPFTAAMPAGRQIPENFFYSTMVMNVRHHDLETARARLSEILKSEYGDMDVAIWQGNPQAPDLDKETTTRSLESLVRLVLVLGFLLVIVSGVGMYGIMTVEVAGKIRFYGIRRALGATIQSIMGLVASQAAFMGLLGALPGLILAAALNHPMIEALSPWFERVGLHQDLVSNAGFNPLPFFLALVLTCAASALFGLLPALRLRKTSPVMLLREETP